MAKAFCLACNSSRVLTSGPRADSVWCLLKRRQVNADFSCEFHPAREAELLDRMASKKMLSELGSAEGRDHVLVKSDPKVQFEPNASEKRTPFLP